MAKIVDQQYIIAIGASAGGLEAISAFFDYTPLDSVSYIVIQHLSADFKSQMVQILSQHSKLKVVEAVENVDIITNTVYLIPSAKFMTVEKGRLILSDKKNHPSPHKTIDYFFSSLAKERGKKAIGIIFSGTGDDGSKGIEAIKHAGGIVLVQDPATAGFNGMPLAAIATDCVDNILSPESMPQTIEEYVKNGLSESPINQLSEQINEKELEQIFNLIKGQLPLDFSDYKRPTIIRRINRRMEQHHLNTVKKYYEFMKDNPDEITLLANDFLISVTSFFRDPAAFKIIADTVVPDIIKKNQTKVLKIWVAGCATGEEAYSIAILVKEYLSKHPKNIEVKIFASDISKAALDVASKGVYADHITKTVSKERLQEFFTKEENTYTVKHEIRQMLIFAQHDLTKNPPYCNVDLISCRNLLIYLNITLQQKVFAMLHFGLKEGGYLFLGPSESASIIKDGFNEINGKWNILKSNKTGRAVRFDAFSSYMIDDFKRTTLEISKKAVIPKSKSDLTNQVNSALLKESNFNGVCTDENLSVVQSFGDTKPYLKNINFNYNLTDLLPEHMAMAFKAAAHKAFTLNERVVLDGIVLEIAAHENRKPINIILSPFQLKESEERLLLVLFDESQTKLTEKNVIHVEDINEVTREHVISLEQEVAQLKYSLAMANERVASSHENLESFNEELQSANEEMQSANEEMQSTNEELQSVNEELQTVNKDHQLTIDNLTDLNDDLNNYFRSNTNGQLFVDEHLLIKRCSPGAQKHINIRESDIGRPLGNITTNIKFETLIEDIKKVIHDGEPITREAEAIDGNIYQVMTMPYLKKGSKISDGAIISFYDITELKKLLKQLDISNKNLDTSNTSLSRINADLNNFVFSASHDLNTPIVNIESLLGLLNSKLDMKDAEVMELFGLMNKAVTNFKATISDLAKVGAIESEDPDERNESFVAIFEEIKLALSEKIKLSKTIFHTNFRKKEVHFAKKNLRSVMLNLITNAIKFSAPNRIPEITIKTEQKEGFIILTVKDNGLGISKDQMENVFKKYQRMNETVEGTGIGLYLTQKIVDAAGGKIEVACEEGKGCTFKIYFLA
ncbi:MAG: PAS domain-containing protein [Bacteroidetes bacterium]|nr:PAS domain-containing protein [Bacteroidota bacterium]MBU1374171.1 PAS domain-containing protein [Bacteroidota bacterium]MBU1484168.1 PAS domain-containing protein [Bacteroidota bacterium]MBU1761512.1 PAS domain-containing protein [Bacteroidota bacterium]MBU2375295.1 PAS domain-containing protein [Bacteroidota bacterium]